MATQPNTRPQPTRLQQGPPPITPVPWWQLLAGMMGGGQGQPRQQGNASGFSLPQTPQFSGGRYPWQTITQNYSLPQQRDPWSARGMGAVPHIAGAINTAYAPLQDWQRNAWYSMFGNGGTPTPATGQTTGGGTVQSAPYVPEGATSYQGQPDRYYGGDVRFQNKAGNGNMGGAGAAAIQAGVGDAGGQGGQVAIAPIQQAHKDLDARLGQGWSEQFAQRHGGVSPIEFYGRAFERIQDPMARLNAAKEAAINDHNFQQGGAIDEWRRVHGAQEIPQEQWEKWWYMAQNGGPNFGQGAGINPWGVY